jgi:hypothetical protein
VSACVGAFAFATMPVASATITCVGARQTSDPMSPICVATFEDDNGGGTWDGVTPGSVDVVLYNDLGLSGSLNTAWSATDEAAGHLADPTGQTTNLVRTAKALVAHFNARYQTYGRTVRVTAFPSAFGETSICASRYSDASNAIGTYQPFAVAALGMGQGCVFDATADASIVGLGLAEEVRDSKVPDARAAFTFAPTMEQTAEATAGFICRSLAGRPASYASGSLTGRTRRFGLIYPSPGETWFADGAALLRDAVRSSCDATFAFIGTYATLNEPDPIGSIAHPGELVSQIRSAGLATNAPTTLVCMCPAENGDARLAIAAARAINYGPEWIWVPSTRMDRATWQRLTPSALGRHFGISPTWLAPAPDVQEAVRAVHDADPGIRPNPRSTTDLFLALRSIFTAIQQAGPTLTPQTVATGLSEHVIASTGADVVQGSYADPGRRSWSDTFVAWWFDAMAAPPGESLPRGCIRLMRDGWRFTADAWPTSDLELFTAGRCSGLLHHQPSDAPAAYAANLLGPN